MQAAHPCEKPCFWWWETFWLLPHHDSKKGRLGTWVCWVCMLGHIMNFVLVHYMSCVVYPELPWWFCSNFFNCCDTMMVFGWHKVASWTRSRTWLVAIGYKELKFVMICMVEISKASEQSLQSFAHLARPGEKNWHQRCFTCRQCNSSLVNQKYYEKVFLHKYNLK